MLRKLKGNCKMEVSKIRNLKIGVIGVAQLFVWVVFGKTTKWNPQNQFGQPGKLKL